MEKQPLQYWNQQARNYDDNIFSTIDEDATGVILDVIRSHGSQDDCRASRCVDLGCGVGKYLPALSKHFRQVMAYDLSPKLVALALKEVKRKNLENVSVAVRDLAQVWYRSDPSGACFGRLDELESFGFGVMANVLIAPGDVQLHELMLCNAHRSLCPGGRLLCIVPSLESALYVHQRCEEERSEGPYCLGAGDSRPSRAEAADLLKGVLRRSGVRTKHFLEPEFRLLASKGGFQVESVQRVTYHWRSELGLASDGQVPQRLRESPLPWDWLFLLHKAPLPSRDVPAAAMAALLPTALREARSESEGRLPTLLRPKKEENGARMTDSQKALFSTNRPSTVSPL